MPVVDDRKMKLDCVLTAVNENPLYLEFVPIFVMAWKKLYPSVDVKIVLVADRIPQHLQALSQHFILFKPLPGVSTGFISQYVRLLYPALLGYQNGIMITDMDMIPMNRKYYTSSVAGIPGDRFVSLRDVLLHTHQEIAMCYCIAHNKIWGKVFQIYSLSDVVARLFQVSRGIQYENKHGGSGWTTDQRDLYDQVMIWHNKTQRFVCLTDQQTGFRRLDRGEFEKIDRNLTSQIKSGVYTDYHCWRPYSKYQGLNNQIYSLL
jgi:hypothetical protein